MSEPSLDAEKEAAIELLTRAYAGDVLSMEQLEDRLTRVTAAYSLPAVRGVVSDLAGMAIQLPGESGGRQFPESQQLVRGSRQSLKREGNWLRAKRIVVIQSGSSIKLDFSQLQDYPRQVFELDLLLEGCSLRIKVPMGTRIDERLEAHSSTCRCSRSLRRGEDPDACTLIIKGRVGGSSVRISPSRKRG